MQDLEQFKNEMNLSGKNVYVGHRYVPKIDGDWENSKTYEALTIVQYQGNSFTSRQFVPTGVDINNEDFWVATGNYNAQIEYYRQDVQDVKDDYRNADAVILNEIIEARNGHENLDERLDSEKIKPSFINNDDMEIITGNELVNVSNAQLGTGWTVSNGGFSHASGNTESLIIPIPNLSSDKMYQIIINDSNPAQGAGGQSDFWIRLGWTKEFETYNGGTPPYKYTIYPGGVDNNLTVRPWEEYTGTLTISVKEVTGAQLDPFLSFYDKDNNKVSEVRTGEFGTNSLYIGYNSGRWSPEGKRNTGVGDISMSRMTDGFWNSALGYGTLQENTVGTRNVALGYIALRNNISGDRNIGIGSFAMTNLKSGRNNVAIGVDSYYHAEIGDGNIAIGLLALATNPNSNYNIAIGNNSMSGSNGGSLNIGIGNDTLRTNRSTGNTALGDKALSQNTYGLSNVAVGIGAIRYGKTGNYNVVMGENAGLYIEGDNNVAIGTRVAQNLDEESQNNIAIGNLALQNASSGDRNIAIGSGTMARDNVDVGDRNIAIGFNALRWANDALNNVAIGDQALTATTNGRRNVAVGEKAGSLITTGTYNVLLGSLVEVPNPEGSYQLNIANAITSTNYQNAPIEMRDLRLTDLPTSAPSEAGRLWRDGNTIKIV